MKDHKYRLEYTYKTHFPDKATKEYTTSTNVSGFSDNSRMQINHNQNGRKDQHVCRNNFLFQVSIIIELFDKIVATPVIQIDFR